MPQSDTPRTDAAEHKLLTDSPGLAGTIIRSDYQYNELLKFARTLERELIEAKDIIKQITTDPNYEGGTYYWIAKHDNLAVALAKQCKEYGKLKAELTELRGVADTLHNHPQSMGARLAYKSFIARHNL